MAGGGEGGRRWADSQWVGHPRSVCASCSGRASNRCSGSGGVGGADGALAAARIRRSRHTSHCCFAGSTPLVKNRCATGITPNGRGLSGYPRSGGHGCLSPAGLALALSLITREHLARYLLRSPGDDRLDGVSAHVFTGDVIDGPEPPSIMLDFQAHFGTPVFRYPAHAVARQARVGFQAGVPFFFVQHGVIPPSRAACGPSFTGNPACGHTYRRLWHYGPCSSCPPRPASP